MEIRVDRRQTHIAIVTIANEARRNAMTRAMMADLAELWDRLDQDDDCRVVVLTGAGDKGFCSGADLAGDLSASPEAARVINRALLKDTPFSKPIVAAVNGDCVAGGVELLLSTDIRAAVPEARFGLPEVRWSIYPFGGATVKLAQQIGHVHAMDLLLTGRLVDAAFAERVGLVKPGGRARPADALGAGDRRGDRRQQPLGGAGGAHPDQHRHRRLRQKPRGAGAGTRRAGPRQPAFRRRRRRVSRETQAGLQLIAPTPTLPACRGGG